jgi:alpha-L-fucosidase
MNRTWGYSEHDHAWKSNKRLIHNLIDIVSKGGNYLLNIGPKGDGSIPQESIDAMERIGKWMAINGQAIYSTTASPFTAPKWGRYTQKPGIIYAHIFTWPQNGELTIPLKKAQIKQAWLLADKAKTSLKIQSASANSTIHLPGKAPDDIASVLVIKYEK